MFLSQLPYVCTFLIKFAAIIVFYLLNSQSYPYAIVLTEGHHQQVGHGDRTLGREWETRVDSRSGDLHRVDSRSGASLLNMNCSIGREITRGWTLGRELLNLT